MENFRLWVLQAPVHGRTCGFTDVKDRRMLDPCLTIELTNEDGSTVFEDDSRLINLQLVCHVSIWLMDKVTDCAYVLNSSLKNPEFTEFDLQRSHMTLVGNVAKTHQKMHNEFGEPKLLYVFPDLTIRVQGKYVLKCLLLDISE